MSNDTPFACQIDALTPAQRDRRSDLVVELLKASEKLDELTDGFAVVLRSGDEAWMAAAEFVTLERRCCPFLSFTLTMEDDSTIRLEITGGAGVKEFLMAELFSKRPH